MHLEQPRAGQRVSAREAWVRTTLEERARPAPSLRKAAPPPHKPRRADQLQTRLRVGLDAILKRAPQIVQLAIELAGWIVHVGTGREQSLGPSQEVMQMAPTCELHLARFSQSLPGILAHGVQQAVPRAGRAGLSHDERLID